MLDQQKTFVESKSVVFMNSINSNCILLVEYHYLAYSICFASFKILSLIVIKYLLEKNF